MKKNKIKHKIISVTGTKGKTTVVRGISYLLNKQRERKEEENNILSVDNDGYYINGVLKHKSSEIAKIYKTAPSVCPGKFLWSERDLWPKLTAVFETSIGCSSLTGLGYGRHDIGLFLNIFEDHIGQTTRLKSKKDLAIAKNFIFKRIVLNGTAIFNADDKYVCSQIGQILENIIDTIKFIPVGIKFTYFNIEKHLKNGGELITVENDWVVLKSLNKTKKMINIKKVSWTFDGYFMPSVWNLMFIVAGFYAYSKKFTLKNRKDLEEYEVDKNGGRLTLFENKKGVKILLDFAHEKQSLKNIGLLARKISKNNKSIGVLRLTPGRPNQEIIDTGKFIAKSFDKFIIYDMVDGVNKKKYESKTKTFRREVGDVARMFIKGLEEKAKKDDVLLEIERKNAIKKASEIAVSGDVVVIISSNGKTRKNTIELIEKYFDI